MIQLRRIALTLGLALSLVLGAAGAAGASAADLVSPKGSVTLEVAQSGHSFPAGDLVPIDVIATNTGTEGQHFWLPTPCDPTFSVTIRSFDGAFWRLGERNPDLYCIQVIKEIHLEPGESIQERFWWDTAKAKPGTYDVTARFLPQNATGSQVPSVTVPLTLTTESKKLPLPIQPLPIEPWPLKPIKPSPIDPPIIIDPPIYIM